MTAKTFTLLLTGLYFFPNPLFPQLAWQRCLGGSNSESIFNVSMLEIPTGGYLLATDTYSGNGDVNGNHGQSDIWVVRLDASGQLLWQKCLGGTKDDQASKILPTTDGNYLIIGATASNNGQVSGNHGGFDFWCVKIDPQGGLLWQKCFGGTADEKAYTGIQLPDGNFALLGRTSSNNGNVSGNHGGEDMWLLKIDPDGNLLSRHCFGGTNDERGWAMLPTSDGGLALAGYSTSSNGDVSANHGGEDYWLLKINAGGTIVWQKNFGGTAADYALDLAFSPDGGFVLAGSSDSGDGDITDPHGGSDLWVIKTNATGELQEQHNYGGSGFEGGGRITRLAGDHYLLGGTTTSADGDVVGNHGSGDYWLVNLDTEGAIASSLCLGGSDGDDIFDVLTTSDGSMLAAGLTRSNDGNVSGNHGMEDLWVAKLQPGALSASTEASQSQLKVYPNPFASEIHIRGMETERCELEIIDPMGRMILSKRSIPGDNTVLAQSWAPGVYTILLKSETKAVFRRVIKME